MQLARNPLLLTLIAYLYAYRGREAKLPRSRAQFYKEATDFLLRNKPELDYSQGTKMAILQRLALAAQDTPSFDLDRQVLPYAKVIATIKEILPATVLREDDVQPLLDEIVTRSGIIKQIRGEQSFHFAHLTLQEFLAAAELADRPDDLIQRYRDDPAIWRETIKLWCGYVSRDSKQVITAVFESDPVLAFECLADAVQVDEPLARKVTHYHEENLRVSNDDAVVQAFGAVASDYGPRGQAVLGFLTSMADAPGDPRHAAAVRALAASKLPHAADVLARLYPNSAIASNALRTMGDLAVPVYVRHTRRGELVAIDDLASIATPAAARELVSLLSSDTDIARWAAWRIASLIKNPDVEEALRASDDLPAPSGQRLDPVWAPFRQQSTAQWLEVMGRVAYLLQASPDDAVPSVVNVDRRIAIPLCATRIFNLIRNTPEFILPDEFKQFIEAAANRRSHRPEELSSATRSHLSMPARIRQGDGEIGIYAWDLEGLLPAIPEDVAGAMYESILQRIGVPRVHQALFAELTPSVQNEIFHRACQIKPSRPASLGDWPDSFIPHAKPRILTTMSGALTGIALAGAAALAIYSFVEIIRGSWTWGPSWLVWISIGLVPLSIGSLVLSDLLTGAVVIFADDVFFFGGVFGLILDLGLLLFYCAIAIREHWGWTVTASIFAPTLIIIGLMWWIVNARNRAIANPLRGLLEVDEQAARNRTSIVA